MSRIFWFALGAGSTVYAMVKTRRAVERFTPSGLADQLAAFGHGVRVFGADVRTEMAEHETQLRDRLALAHGDGSGPRAIGSGPRTRPTHGRGEGST